jgi:hypothetical protein
MEQKVFGIKGEVKPQIAAKIFTRNMSAMKNILSMGEFKFGGKENEGYKFFKKTIMDQIYESLIDTYKELELHGVVVNCGCNSSIIEKRGGYNSCQWCNGCGYKNSKEYNDFLDNISHMSKSK